LLEPITVLDLTHFLAGPYCTLVLAELGADVIRVEDPAHPDEARSMPPFFVGGQSTYFLSLNSAKRSLALPLATEEGRTTFYRLVERADVVVDNFRPGVMSKLALDHDRLAERNPRIVTCSLTGFGEDGPYAQRPGYDYTVTALAGIQHLTGDPPSRAGISYADHSGGLAAAVAILAALLERSRTGRGRHLDVSLLDVQLSMLTYLAAGVLNAGDDPRPIPGGGHPILVPTQNLETADGWVAFFVGNDAMWRRAREALEVPELDDPRFDTVAGRAAHKEEVLRLVGERLRRDTTAHWVERLERAGVPCAPVNDVPAALRDPQALARGMVLEERASYGEYRRVGGPLPRLRVKDGPAPELGRDSEEVMRELSG
jgi:crotonobetainyl-CoA:carnitine CoA-transferase CaiB-like acyl-CoA transferase